MRLGFCCCVKLVSVVGLNVVYVAVACLRLVVCRLVVVDVVNSVAGAVGSCRRSAVAVFNLRILVGLNVVCVLAAARAVVVA